MTDDIFIGLDIGGTKMAAAAVSAKGDVLARTKSATPMKAGPEMILKSVLALLRETMSLAPVANKEIVAIGVGVPGIVCGGRDIVVTPNIDLAGFPLAGKIEKELGVKVVLGNDVNLGLLGEQWRGAGQAVGNIVGIFPGTGVGGAVIVEGTLLTGSRGAAAEIGHMLMTLDGPKCGCGNRGCLEALASRRALERDIRQAVKQGAATNVVELNGGGLGVIKSRVLREALNRKDPLITQVMKRLAMILGKACISMKHIFNPELIILGGGLMEACGEFLLPRIRQEVNTDPFFTAPIDPCRIVLSQLGDDAVILGAVALVLRHKPAAKGVSQSVIWPKIHVDRKGDIAVDNKIYKNDIYIRADGKLKRRDRGLSGKFLESVHKLGVEELRKLCKKKPELFIIASGQTGCLQLTEAGKGFLERQGIPYEIYSTRRAISLYNRTIKKKAILLHLAC
jgi:glucokinase